MSRIRAGDLLVARADVRSITQPGQPIFREEIGIVRKGESLIALEDEFTHFTCLGEHHRFVSYYVRVLTEAGRRTFVDPACLSIVSDLGDANMITERE
jgi:hypothetical protein